MACLTDSHLLFFVVRVEDTNIFLNEKISASSEVFEVYFAFLSEVLSGSVKLRHQKCDILIQFSLYLACFPVFS